MKVLLVYPPDRTLPTIPFSSLAVLQGCLRGAGYETKVRDLNAEVFDFLVRKERLSHYADMVKNWFDELNDKGSLTEDEFGRYRFLAPIAGIPRKALEEAEEAVALMRDGERFYDHAKFNEAFDTLASMIRFLYAASPLYEPEADDFVSNNLATLETFGGDPVDEALNNVLDSVLDEEPDAVFITMPFTFQFFEGLRFAKRFKQRFPNVPIAIGGCTVNDYKENLFKDPALFDVIDFGMPGEGEDAAVELIEHFEGKRKIEEVSNAIWRDENGVIQKSPMPPSYPDLDTIAPPDFADIPFERYLVPEGIANLQTSRGCYYGKCTFCGDSFRRNFRMRKPSLVYEDIKGIYEQTGVRFFLFWDSLAPPKTLRTVAEGIKGDNLPIYWFAETKFEKPYVNPKLIQTLYDGGGRFLQFGFESGSQRVLDLIDKGNDLARVDRILENMHNSGLKAGVSWFIGFPGETPEEANYTYDFVHQRRDRIAISVYAGTFMLGADTLVFADPDRYDIEIFRTETGGWDYRHKDGRPYYDRTAIDEGFRARSDLPLLTHGAYLLYATFKVDDLEKITGLGRFGPISREMIDDQSIVLNHGDSYVRCTYNYDATLDFTPGDDGKMVQHPVEVVSLLKNGQTYKLDDFDKRLLELVDGKRSIAEVIASFDEADRTLVREKIEQMINRAITPAPREAAAAPQAAIAPAAVSA